MTVRWMHEIGLVKTNGRVSEDDFDAIAAALFALEATVPTLSDCDVSADLDDQIVVMSFTFDARSKSEAEATASSVYRRALMDAFGANTLHATESQTRELHYA